MTPEVHKLLPASYNAPLVEQQKGTLAIFAQMAWVDPQDRQTCVNTPTTLRHVGTCVKHGGATPHHLPAQLALHLPCLQLKHATGRTNVQRAVIPTCTSSNKCHATCCMCNGLKVLTCNFIINLQ